MARDTNEAEAGMKGMERRFADAGMDTLTLLSLTTPFLQLIDAEARGFAGDELVLVLTEFDSSLWDVRAVDERVLSELRHHYPDAKDLSTGRFTADGVIGGSRPR
ncbi:hypothetical protein C5L38_33905 (plasmid) [Streptomyces sp. WAC00288]|uniref:hypothetical protein n=1 Tax=unclassified Streptomyces TaxID=2593676 RepID=UPI0009A050DE|nr:MULTISPECIES: hypothetical protein [unclassified Streptomyces]AVI00073.1 hypothetical protein C5L38_33905 [Streptomyces sp. WAC00288]